MRDLDPGAADPSDITGDYTVDGARSRLGFVVRHAVVTRVRGRFTQLSGTAHVDAHDPSASRVDLALVTSSVETGSADRDRYLLTTDFFGAEDDPVITFASTGVVRDGSDWTITGDLTIKGVTRSVTIDFAEVATAADPSGRLRLDFEGTTTINRADWGLTFPAVLETGGVLVSEKVTLELVVSAVRDA